MKILFICSGFGRTYRGVETWVAELSEQFAKMGHEVTIFAGYKSNVKLKGINVEKFKIIYRDSFGTIPKRKYFELLCYWAENLSLTAASFCALKRGNFDLIFISSWADGFSTLFLKKLGFIKSKTIYTFHGGTANKWLLPLIFPVKFADAVVGVSYFVTKNASKLLKRNFETIYNGVNTHYFKPRNLNRKFDLLYVGALLKKKGIYTLIEAVSPLRYKLGVIGDGPEKKNLLKITKGNRNIKMLGAKKHSELPTFYNESEVVIVPSEYPEAQTIVPVEAMACEVPVIAADIGGLGESVKKFKGGLTYQPGNVKELRKLIEFLMKNPNKRKELGKKGRAFVEKNLDWKIIAKKYLILVK
ncbi:MAG: glycosyltransferase family 4 protein [Candidatus Pacearchaeota archaeon]